MIAGSDMAQHNTDFSASNCDGGSYDIKWMICFMPASDEILGHSLNLKLHDFSGYLSMTRSSFDFFVMVESVVPQLFMRILVCRSSFIHRYFQNTRFYFWLCVKTNEKSKLN